MTYNELKSIYLPQLTHVSDNPTFELESLFLAATGMKKSDFLLKRRDVLSQQTTDTLLEMINRRINREPLQYIIGEWEFFGLRIFCGDGCLIPRPETELLTETAIKTIPRNGKFLDLCTGSGCISIAILNNRPDVSAVAVDISPKALEYAKKNAQYHGISSDRLEFVCADIYDYIPKDFFDFIVSNPPYIKSADMQKLQPEVLHEPSIALDGGYDGLDFYKLIAKYYAKRYLSQGGYCAVEVGYDISEEVAAIFRSQKFDSSVIRDMFEVDRVCISRK